MKQNILPAIKLTLACILIFMGFYTVIILAIAKAAPAKGKGETIMANGKVVGYALEGQTFNQDNYFWGRPSAAGYNAAASAGSNKGTSNPDYLKEVQSRIDTFLAHNPTVKKEEIPSEMVTASGSGLDPDISPAAALIQVKRIAAIRKTDEQKIFQIIARHTQIPVFGPKKIRVLELNIALNQLR